MVAGWRSRKRPIPQHLQIATAEPSEMNKRRPHSRGVTCVAIVVPQQLAEAFAALDCTFATPDFLAKVDDLVAEAPVISFLVVLIVKMLALLHLNNLLELLADAAVPRACFHGVDHVVPEFAA